MATQFRCPCGQKLKTRDEFEGKRARCPKCSAWLRVPKSSTYDTVAELASTGAGLPKPEPAPAPDVGAPQPFLIAPEAEPPKGRVLVADSSKMDREETVEVLRSHHYIVLEATDGAQALEMIRKERPDVAVLNVKLEGMSGFQVLQQMRHMTNVLNKDVWKMPVLMTTERLHGRDKQYAISLGMDGFFVKPVPVAEFVAKLEKITVRRPPG